jgi:hypothetical protein
MPEMGWPQTDFEKHICDNSSELQLEWVSYMDNSNNTFGEKTYGPISGPLSGLCDIQLDDN